MAREITLEYYPGNKEINILLEIGNETKTVSLINENKAFYDKHMIIETEQFLELYNTLAEVNIKEFLDNNGEGNKDGAYFEIAFGGGADKVQFLLADVHKDNMEKRKKKAICDVVKKILEIAEIDKAEYEMDI
jgi:hypothetical protein